MYKPPLIVLIMDRRVSTQPPAFSSVLCVFRVFDTSHFYHLSSPFAQYEQRRKLYALTMQQNTPYNSIVSATERKRVERWRSALHQPRRKGYNSQSTYWASLKGCIQKSSFIHSVPGRLWQGLQSWRLEAKEVQILGE